jgi:hypothetical protein
MSYAQGAAAYGFIASCEGAQSERGIAPIHMQQSTRTARDTDWPGFFETITLSPQSAIRGRIFIRFVFAHRGSHESCR